MDVGHFKGLGFPIQQIFNTHVHMYLNFWGLFGVFHGIQFLCPQNIVLCENFGIYDFKFV